MLLTTFTVFFFRIKSTLLHNSHPQCMYMQLFLCPFKFKCTFIQFDTYFKLDYLPDINQIILISIHYF